MRRALDGRTQAHGRAGVLTEYFSHDLPMPWTLEADYRSVRTHRHKLIDWVQHPDLWEMYDLAADPFETVNLYGTPAAEAVSAALRRELRALVAESVGL